MYSDWQRIESGADLCNPCRPPVRDPRHGTAAREPWRGTYIVIAAVSSRSEEIKPPSARDLVGAAAVAVGLISAWLYAAGWTYAYHYLDRFGIPLLMVDISKENYFVYGSVVMRQFPVSVLIITAAGIALVALWRWIGWLLGRLTLPLWVLAVLALFWLGHEAGVATAHAQYLHQRENDYNAYPRVQIWTNEDATLPAGSPPASDDLARGCYRLLLHNQDRLFLMRPFKGAAAADLPVLILPWDLVGMIRVLPDHTSCQ